MTTTPLTVAAVMARVTRSYWLLEKLFRRDVERYRIRVSILTAFHVAFPVLALLSGYVENTLWLPGKGRGVLEHYGFHALFLSAPVLAFLGCRLSTLLAQIIAEPLRWLAPTLASGVTRLQESLEDVVLCRTLKAKGFLMLLRIIGFFAVIANASSTRMPELVYGQDVFDSSRHILGYFTGRLFLAYSWIYLWPLVAYLAIAAVVAVKHIAAHVDELPDYEVRCFASDGCGGFKELGHLMTFVVYLWVPIVIVVIALMQTHTNFYATLKLSTVLAVLIPSQLFLPFLRLHNVLARLKRDKLAEIERYLTAIEHDVAVGEKSTIVGPSDPGTKHSATIYLRLLAGESIYRHTVAMTTWPYVKTDAFRWLTPFVPIALSFTLKRLGFT